VDLQFGKPVVSTSGDKVGSVDSLIIDYNTKDVRAIMVKSGTLLSTDRIISVDMIDHIDNDGTVHLDIGNDLVEQQPPFVEREYVLIEPDAWPEGPAPLAGGAGGYAGYWTTDYPGLGYSNKAPFFSTAPLDPPEVVARSNLQTDDVVINKGTDVVGRDGDKVGTVDEIIYGSDDRIDGFVVKAGFLFHHDVRVPARWIESVTNDKVKLNVTADEAEHANDSAS